MSKGFWETSLATQGWEMPRIFDGWGRCTVGNTSTETTTRATATAPTTSTRAVISFPFSRLQEFRDANRLRI